MSGQRGHSRVRFSNTQGVLFVSRDVVVTRATDHEFIAVADQPALPGDTLVVAVTSGEGGRTETVRVIACRPVVVDGIVKHEVRLSRNGHDGRDSDAPESRSSEQQ
jgi:hypothetical protein